MEPIFHFFEQCVEREPSITNRGELDRHILVDVGGVKRRMGDAHAFRHRRRKAGTGEAATDAEHEIGVLQEGVELL